MTAGRNKVVSGPEAATLTREAQGHGEVVVHCHGCFDIVHPGHVRHLQQAAKLGDRLLVTVTGDALMGKGSNRPLIPEELRAENLAALDCVSWVAVSRHATARELLLTLRPDVYVKGREYQHNHDPRFEEEKVAVDSYGGRVVFTSGDVVFSSTALVAALEASEDPVRIALEPLIRHHRLDPDGLDAIVAGFRGRRVLVVGETIIDTYVICDQPVVAGEGPLMTLRPLEYRSFDGGAAIIARHLAALGARPTLLTPLPTDGRADALRLRLEVEGVEVHTLGVDGPLIEKQRYMVGTNKVMKVDLAPPMTLDARDQTRVVDQAADLAAASEAMIVADFGLGFLSAPMLHSLCTTARRHVDLMAGDVSGQRSNLLAMHDMDLLCPSEAEIRGALHDYEEGLSAVVWRLLEQTRSRAALVTLGHEGLIAFDPQAGAGGPDDWAGRMRADHVPSLVPYAVDQLGCGDALLATATLARLVGASLPAAAVLGSLAAAAEARKLGNAVIGAGDLRRGIRRLAEARLTFDPEPAATRSSRHDQLSHSYPQSS